MPQQTSTFESHFLTHMQGVAGAYHKVIACSWVPILQVGGLGKVWVNCFPKAITTWLGWESNPRPPDPESDALTTLPYKVFYVPSCWNCLFKFWIYHISLFGSHTLLVFLHNIDFILFRGLGISRGKETFPNYITGKQSSFNTCLRRIFGIRWSDRERNEVSWERAGQEPVSKQILKRKWSWIGHTLRKPPNNTTRQVLRWNPQGKRKRGWPRNSWRQSTETYGTAGNLLEWGDKGSPGSREMTRSCRWPLLLMERA